MAASILWAADFFSTKHLIDPMAGSGTFSLEGPCGRYPKILRRVEALLFKSNLDLKNNTWDYLIQKENPLSIESKLPKQNTLLKELPSFTIGDYDLKAIETILHNIKASQIPSDILKRFSRIFFR
jgi:23S rRNA G2445 N2-methylase RlmL